MASTWTPWSADEVSALHEIYPQRGVAGFRAIYPARTPEAIRSMAKKHKVYVRDLYANGVSGNAKAWSDQETALLTRIYPTATAKELRAAFPGCGKNSVYAHAFRIGLRRGETPKTAVAAPILKMAASPNAWDKFVHKLVPAGAWKIDHPTACRSVFELGVV